MTTGIDLAREISADLATEGLANRFTLITPSQTAGPSYEKISATPNEHELTCRPVKGNNAYMQRTGTVIEDGERAFTVFNTLGITPQVQHTAKFYGSDDVWQISAVTPMDFDETPYAWLVKLKR